ncbi:MAG: hypothetical protein K4H23_04385 [Mollicutes bacterium PWAP]|nr:hypothetical protein [Mollicutes bacterium PWAP]
MTKKSWIILGTSLGVLFAGGTAIGVGIALNNHKKSWTVNIANDNGVRYFVSIPDSSHLKHIVGDVLIFDIDDRNHLQVLKSAEKLSIKEGDVTSTLKEPSKYKNGLVKLAYDLIHIEKRAE